VRREESGVLGRQAGVPLSPSLLPWLDELLAPLREGTAEQCLSDWSAGNLYLFRRVHDYRLHQGEFAYLSGHTYDGTAHVMPLFDLDKAPASVVADLALDARCLYPVSEAQKSRLDPERFRFSTSRDDADYLYPADNFRFYRGSMLGKKRNLMKQLLAAHVVRAQPFSPACRDTAAHVLKTWMDDRGKGEGEADHLACLEALEHAHLLGLEGFVFLSDDEPAGFLLAEEMQPGVFVIRFAKGIDRFKGIAQYMFHHFCTAFHRPVRWMNFEQDMGLENFRRTKASYQPAGLLSKYRVFLR
jgi:hypothetical protein